MNDQENFAEDWSKQDYEMFLQWHRQVLAWLQKLRETRGRGADVLLNTLNAKFGKEQIIRVANSVGVDTRRLHEAGQLRVDTMGKVGAIGAGIPKTINFGR